jgi:sulfur-carrier protein
MPRVFIPPAMRELAHGQSAVDANGATVLEIIADVDRQLPGFRDRVCQQNALRPGLSVVVNGSVSALGTLQRVGNDDEIHFLPAIGGG